MLGENFKLYRCYKNGRATISGFLDDYSFTIQAFISLYQVTLDENWIITANSLTSFVIDHFFNEESGLFYFSGSSNDNKLSQKTEIHDSVIPSSNSTMALNLYYLYKFFNNISYREIAQNMLNSQRLNIYQYIRFYAKWGIVELFSSKPSIEIVITGSQYLACLNELIKEFRPGMLFAGCNSESELPILKNRYVKDKTFIYICKNNTCKLPVETIDKAKNILMKTNN